MGFLVPEREPSQYLQCEQHGGLSVAVEFHFCQLQTLSILGSIRIIFAVQQYQIENITKDERV